MKLHRIIRETENITYTDIINFGKYYLIYGNDPKYVSILRGTDKSNKSNASVFDEITKVTIYIGRDRLELLTTIDLGQTFCNDDMIYELTDSEVLKHIVMELI